MSALLRTILLIFFALSSFACTTKQKRLNVLIIGTCSVKKERLSVYDKKLLTTPNLKKFSENSFIFNNAYSSTSWLNFVIHLDKIPEALFEKNGYRLPGDNTSARYARRLKKQLGKLPTNYYQRILMFKNQSEQVQLIKDKIFKNKEQPFFLALHFKYPHIPYIDRKNPHYERFFSAESKKHFQHYLALDNSLIKQNPTPVLLFKKNHLRVLKDDNLHLGDYLYDRKMLNEWRKSKNYNKDIQLIKESYDGKLFHFDHSLNELFNLYGDKELQENTVVIFTGDHGEEHMEHGNLLHGNANYDTSIGFPLIIKFPKSRNTQYIEKQINQSSIYEIVEAIVRGDLNANNFSTFVDTKINDEKIFSTNCTNSILSLRLRNKWKFIYNLKNDSRELYQLDVDPIEKNNVFRKFPKQSAFMEELLLNRDEIPIEGSCTPFQRL